MKQLLLLLLFIPLVSFGQTVVGDFKIDNGEIIWQKIYDDSLNITSQDLVLKPIGLPFSTTIYLKQVSKAKLSVPPPLTYRIGKVIRNKILNQVTLNSK